MTLPTRTWTLLTLLAGVALLDQGISLQGFLSTGDHGRDLYAAAHAFDGSLPYRDYWWVYGPLMPFYYGLGMLVGGVTVQSVLVAMQLLYLGCGLLIMRTIARLEHPAFGLAAAVWFWCTFPGFFFTYNHAGGILAVCGLVYALTAFLDKGKSRPLFLALPVLTILLLIKLNMGLAALVLTVVAAGLGIKGLHFHLKQQPAFWISLLLAVPLLTTLVHWFLLKGLSADEIRQCFPYTPADQQYLSSPWTAAIAYLKQYIAQLKNSPAALGMLLTTLISLAVCTLAAIRRTIPPERLYIILTLGLLAGFLSHEYLRSGVFYRFGWVQPVWMTCMFLLTARAWRLSNSSARNLIAVLLLLTTGSAVWGYTAKIRETLKQSAFLTIPGYRPGSSTETTGGRRFKKHSPCWKKNCNRKKHSSPCPTTRYTII